jgi:PAS domain S-box-containing protein
MASDALPQWPKPAPGVATEAPPKPEPGSLAERAGALALRLAELAAGGPDAPGMPGPRGAAPLAIAIAEVLLSAAGADAIVLLAARELSRAKRASGRVLDEIAVAGEAIFSPALYRRLRARGYRLLAHSSHHQMRTALTSTDPAIGALTFALPLGDAAFPAAICVAHWDDHRGDVEDGCMLLRKAAPALALALRALQVSDAGPARNQAAGRASSSSPPIFALTSEAILSLDDDCTIAAANPAFERLLGWEADSVAGRRCTEVLRCQDQRKLVLCGTPRCPLRQALAAPGTPLLRDLAWETRAGPLREVSASVGAHGEGRARHAIFVARDVTALNAANRVRASFISMVSHELRTPLNSINGFLEIVLEGHTGPLTERQREFLNYARVSTHQLTTLVEDVLFLSKADAGQFTLRLRNVDVAALLDQVVQAARQSANHAQVELHIEMQDELPCLRADEVRMAQVLNNLIGNAIKFSPAGAAVTVSAEPQADTILFAVADAGEGIATQEHDRIFGRFYQPDSSTRTKAGGYGLGLAIAKLIVEQHHGRIWVESQPGSGATFFFAVPLAGPPPSA